MTWMFIDWETRHRLVFSPSKRVSAWHQKTPTRVKLALWAMRQSHVATGNKPVSAPWPLSPTSDKTRAGPFEPQAKVFARINSGLNSLVTANNQPLWVKRDCKCRGCNGGDRAEKYGAFSSWGEQSESVLSGCCLGGPQGSPCHL